MKHTDFWRLKCRNCGSCNTNINSDDEKTITIKCNECGYFKKVNSKTCSLLNLNDGINRGDIYEFNTGEKPTEEHLEIINKFEKSVSNYFECSCGWKYSYYTNTPLRFYLEESLCYAAEQSEGKVEYVEGEML